MDKTRFDIEAENLDLYFAKEAQSLSQPARELIPKDVWFKFKNNKLSFLAKIWVLWRCLRKRVWIVVEDEEHGFSPEQFLEYKAALKRKELGIEKAEGFISTGTFITANKELGDTFDYLNRLSTSGAYNYLLRSKNKVTNKTAQKKEEMLYICRFLSNWEASKKKIVSHSSLSMPEIYVLLYYYHGKEAPGGILYKEVYKSAYQSSPTRIKAAFRSLYFLKYLEKSGSTKKAMFKITALGTDAINGLLSKYVLNC